MLENLLGKEFYNAYFHYIVGVCILILGVVVANIIVVILRDLLTHEGATPEDKTKVVKLVSKIHFPINLVFIALSIYVVHKLGDFPAKFEPYLLQCVKTTLDISFFMTVYHFVGALVLTRLFKGFGLTINDTIKELLANAVKIVIAVLGVVTVLGNFNINIGPILGGLTLLTTAVALAAKDSIQGLIGSLTVVLEGKFKEGDWVKMGELQGFVENIGIRTTTIRGFDRTLTTVPNDAFVAASVTNFSRITNWEVKEEFVLAHTSTQEQLEKIVASFSEWLANNPDVEADPKKAIILVRVSNLVQHGFNLLVMFYAKTNQWPEHVRVREQCMFQLLKIIEDAGTSLAHPLHTVFLGESAPLDKVIQIASAAVEKKPALAKPETVKKPAVPKEKK
ncbi:mechanosensitive ion channel family protein [Candidatus Bodocaedibacter vickermanii]|uniref:Low conductance mechanosensitive channel YnaI n=1 Tax=Candidatus Bodocaedibacter vickermanii TaxID=2741701 RepID=A0A7L9RTC1_9PROT|nr:Low conductance mechanosensitive channel YnaI [Candidatus Paracaedibacteraceae bacterium 'Lake Konstanz']